MTVKAIAPNLKVVDMDSLVKSLSPWGREQLARANRYQATLRAAGYQPGRPVQQHGADCACSTCAGNRKALARQAEDALCDYCYCYGVKALCPDCARRRRPR